MTTQATQESLIPDPFRLLPPIFRDCVDDVVGVARNLCVAFPQPVGPHVVATDGRIMVRVKATPEILATIVDISPKRFPTQTASEMIGPRDRWHAEPTPLPSLDHLERCRDCKGEGHLPERKCSCEDMWDEGETPCRGRGTIPAGPCHECAGTGIRSAYIKGVDLREDVRLCVAYIHLLAKHGATLYLPVEPNTPPTVTPVYFTAGEAEGVLMPMTISEPEKKVKAGAAS